VLDEVGMQYGTDGEVTILAEVLDRRYREQRPVIVVTNQPRKGLAEYIGERAMRRIDELCRWVLFERQPEVLE
jgi:DNA replication protein DnaC